MEKIKKPTYVVPSLVEIRAIPDNGFRVISFFAGCGGSSLGYRLAGFRVLWANEFIPAARESYRLNASPSTVLDARDIRQIRADEVLAAIGRAPGEVDCLDGSPPCASFSTMGKRAADWGKVKAYSDSAQRTDDLFFEYARMVDGIRPKVFVAENVSGLVKGVAKGYFKEIIRRLREVGGGYHVEARLLDAQWLGVPQTRQRIIFIGVRKDLGLSPVFPKPLSYRYSVRDAIISVNISVEALQEVDISRFEIGKEWKKLRQGEGSKRFRSLIKAHMEKPCPTILADVCLGSPAVTHPTEFRKFTMSELRRICAFPDDFRLVGRYSQQWERLGRAVPPIMMKHIAETIRDEILEKSKKG